MNLLFKIIRIKFFNQLINNLKYTNKSYYMYLFVMFDAIVEPQMEQELYL